MPTWLKVAKALDELYHPDKLPPVHLTDAEYQEMIAQLQAKLL